MGKFRGLDADQGWVNRRFRELERQIRELSAAKVLSSSTMSRGTLKVTGDATLDVDGNLTLRPGIIETDALAAPIAAGYAYLTASNFALSVAGANVIDSTVTVPEGFTSAVVTMTGRVFAYNSTAAARYLYAQVKVNGLSGNALPVHAAAAGSADDSAIASSPFSTVLTGLTPGGTFPLQLFAKTTAAWAADVANTAELTGSIIWFA